MIGNEIGSFFLINSTLAWIKRVQKVATISRSMQKKVKPSHVSQQSPYKLFGNKTSKFAVTSNVRNTQVQAREPQGTDRLSCTYLVPYRRNTDALSQQAHSDSSSTDWQRRVWCLAEVRLIPAPNKAARGSWLFLCCTATIYCPSGLGGTCKNCCIWGSSFTFSLGPITWVFLEALSHSLLWKPMLLLKEYSLSSK